MGTEESQAGRPALPILINLIAGLLILFVLNSIHFLLAHTFAEMFSIGVALVIFFIAWNAREYYENSYFIFIGAAYLYVGIVDLLHTLVYEGMNILPAYGSNTATQLWIIGRYIESIALLIAPFFLKRRISGGWTVVIWGIVAAAAIASVFGGVFPTCYVEGSGLTAFKIANEFIIIALLGVTMVLLNRHRTFFSKQVLTYLYSSLVITVCSELAFIMYVDVYDLSNLIGHYFKIASFYFIYRGVIVTGFKDPYSFVMRELKERNKELEQSRNEIEQARRINATMLDNVPEEIVLLDRKTCRVIDANRTFLEARGYSREELTGETCFDMGNDSFAPCSEGEVDCRTDAAGPRMETRYDGEGNPRFMEVILLPVDHEGEQPEQLVYIARDITAHKRAEQLREDVEKIMRHDLKSPLSGIIGGTKLLKEDDNLTDEQKEMLEAIKDSGTYVLGLVNRSLNLYQLEEGMYTLQREEFDLTTLLRQLPDQLFLGKFKPEMHLSFIVEGKALEESPPFSMNAEKQGIETVLLNLVKNAMEASSPQEEVSVEVRREADTVVLTVHNEGLVPPEIRDCFFDKYVTAGKRHGTGLGTYSSYLIVQAHGGSVSFTSEEGEGTSVTARIPSP